MNTIRLWAPQLFATTIHSETHLNGTSSVSSICDLLMSNASKPTENVGDCGQRVVSEDVYFNSMVTGFVTGIGYLIAGYLVKLMDRKWLLGEYFFFFYFPYRFFCFSKRFRQYLLHVFFSSNIWTRRDVFFWNLLVHDIKSFTRYNFSFHSFDIDGCHDCVQRCYWHISNIFKVIRILGNKLIDFKLLIWYRCVDYVVCSHSMRCGL